MINIMTFKCCLYYQQAIAQVFISNPMTVTMRSFASIFDLSLEVNSGIDDDPFCFIDGLTAKGKILLDLFVPIMILLFIGIISFLSRCCKKVSSPTKQRKINLSKTMISTYLMIMGKILDVLFRLLTCTNVGDDTIHFYFADEDCYEQTWIISLIILLIMVGGFVAVFTKLREVGANKRQDPSYYFHIITSRYKPQYYYWELIIFIRRIIIALFAVSEPNIGSKFIFIAMMIFFLYLQYSCNPFIIHQGNKMEFILLGCFIFLNVIQLPLNPAFDTEKLNIIISILIIYPLILILYKLDGLQQQLWVNKKDDNVLIDGDMSNEALIHTTKYIVNDPREEENNVEAIELEDMKDNGLTGDYSLNETNESEPITVDNIKKDESDKSSCDDADDIVYDNSDGNEQDDKESDNDII